MAKKIISAEKFEEMYKSNPASLVGYWVTKEDFFALTVLREMREALKGEDGKPLKGEDGKPVFDIAAGERTYQGWIVSGRIREEGERVEDPTGLTPDKILITLEARYVNSERRKYNLAQAVNEESRKRVAAELMPAALQN